MGDHSSFLFVPNVNSFALGSLISPEIDLEKHLAGLYQCKSMIPIMSTEGNVHNVCKMLFQRVDYTLTIAKHQEAVMTYYPDL